jgi:hypothetical protein
MRAVKDIKRKIDQKDEEVQRLRADLVRAEAYLEALRESLKLIQRDSGQDGGNGIRVGSMIAKARDALRKEGQPLHVEEILRRMGREVTKKSRASLSGSLGTYVRDGNMFTRPMPNTFGLMEFEADAEREPPEGFGE